MDIDISALVLKYEKISSKSQKLYKKYRESNRHYKAAGQRARSRLATQIADDLSFRQETKTTSDFLSELRLELGLISFASCVPSYTSKRIRIVSYRYDCFNGPWLRDTKSVHEHIERLIDAYGHKYKFEIEP